MTKAETIPQYPHDPHYSCAWHVTFSFLGRSSHGWCLSCCFLPFFQLSVYFCHGHAPVISCHCCHHQPDHCHFLPQFFGVIHFSWTVICFKYEMMHLKGGGVGWGLVSDGRVLDFTFRDLSFECRLEHRKNVVLTCCRCAPPPCVYTHA